MRAKEKAVANSQIIIYKDATGSIKLDVRFDGDTVWLSQKMMADLFGVEVNTINYHIKEIFRSQELEEESVIRKIRITASDQKSYLTSMFNLDAVISVGYRVNSRQATHFRIWATQTLREFLVKGFVLDDTRLKNPDVPFDYFEELTHRIQDIRTSEKRFYRKITDIYSLSVDYDPTDELSITFFKTVQNKLHWAITGMTAAEIIVDRVNSNKQNLGLTNWKGNQPRRDDVTVAKNYLTQEELAALNNLVEQYLIFAEGQALRRIPMKMVDWLQKLDGFLQLNDRDILKDAGRISHMMAKELAEREYDKFNVKRLASESTLEDDFEKAVSSVVKKRKN
jgi:hypothetical protein